MKIEDEWENMGPSGVERPHRLNLTKSDVEMPDKLDTSLICQPLYSYKAVKTWV